MVREAHLEMLGKYFWAGLSDNGICCICVNP